MAKTDKSISIVICGEAGQGIQTVEFLLTRIFKAKKYNVYATKEYMSRIRGGSNSTQIIISSNEVRAPMQRIDIAVLLDKDALGHIKERISESSLVLGEKSLVGDSSQKIIDIPFLKIANEIGNKIYANIVAVGAIAGILGVKQKSILDCLKMYFADKKEEVIANNYKAVKRGQAAVKEIIARGIISLERFSSLKSDPEINDHILCNGAQSIGLGALAGGCNFVSSYPMSPSTAVLVFMAQNARQFNVIVEQAEDEISAINMAIGAWYAGARALVTTSGGGFALMEEGVSLAGMLEMPIVVHIAQRPGPATGLPTRTEQADLELTLYSGHGEFPRVIFTPGSIEDAFFCAQRAFNIADKYQIPVFILTDQCLMDSYYNTSVLSPLPEGVQNYIVKTDKSYKRYCLTKNGISLRGIPGYGEGLVLVDSDEHDEYGRITEDMEIRKQMVDKRLKKLDLLVKEVIKPRLLGNPDYTTLLVAWGSTYNIVKETLKWLRRDDIALLHFNQVYPLHKSTAGYLKKAKKTIIIENNATSQFGKLIKLYTGIGMNAKILKYNGLPFFVDELVEKLDNVI